MIRIGPAGWSYRDWEGIVYPTPRPKGFQPLALIARMFDLVEVNVTFYSPPKPETAAAWCDLLDRLGTERFRFTVKLWQGLTHRSDLPDKGEIDRLCSLCKVLHDRGRLSALLAQFPWSFKNAPLNRTHIREIADAWDGFPLAVEVRHASWDDESFREWLRGRGLALVNVDQPVIGESLGPSAHVTSPRLGYVRLHGQNREKWFAENVGAEERYNYLYSSEELAPWAVRIGQVSEQAEETVVVTNNHYRGQAIVNAIEIQAACLPERPVAAPQPLIAAYPQLRAVPGLRTAEEAELMPPPGAGEDMGQLEMF